MQQSIVNDTLNASHSFTLRVLLALFAFAAVWAYFGQVDIIAEAPGKLIPSTFVKVVQPTDAGVVTEILVTEGQAVKEGQVLMRLDQNLSLSDKKAVKAELEQTGLALRRIDAELSGKMFAMRGRDSPELAAQAMDQFRARRQAYQDALAQESGTLLKLRNELQATQQIKEKYEHALPSYRAADEAYRGLYKDGFAPRQQSLEKERERIEKEKDYQAQIYTEQSLRAGIAAQERRVAQVTSDYQKNLQQERSDIVTRHEKLQAEWDKLEHKAGFFELKAPKGGVVKDLAFHNTGAVVSPGTVLATLVPVDEPLQAEVWVKNEDVGFLYPGQAAKVKVSTFPFQKYGLVPAEVRVIGADSSEGRTGEAAPVQNTSPAGQPPSYRTLVLLKAQDLVRDGSVYALKTGMQVQVEVNLGTRSVLEYLLSPMQKTTHEAMRER